jgi:macrolide transport system ATP-binding/permease protein
MKRLTAELEKNKIEKPQEEAKVLFQFDSSGKRGRRVLEAKDLEKTFGQLPLIKKSHFYIKHGERIGMIGKNGAGKSTLIRIIQGMEDVTGGELWKSETMKIAYLSQDVNDLKEDETVLRALDLHEREQILRARTIFANMGLPEEKIQQTIGSLSLGERTRVKLVSMILKEYDVLILDEPTNHLDLPSREQLEETLDEFEGTIIIVSHDQYFINKLCDKLLVFEDGTVRRVEMKLDDYFSKSKSESNETDIEKELLKIDHQLTAVLSKLSVISRDDPSFELLDAEYSRLLKAKKKLTG